MAPTLRIARPTADLVAILAFYGEGLGLDLLFRFEDHDGFSGVMLGEPGAAYHFEFTTGPRPATPLAPDPDDLIVFYLPNGEAWRAAVERLRTRGHAPVAPANPYWAERGVTFLDPDGRRVVLENDAWRR